MRVALLNTGTELLLGDVQDAHLTFIAREILPLGLRIAEQRARDLGNAATVLGVEVNNHAAHRLYERLGYRDWSGGEFHDSYTWTDDAGTDHEQEETIIFMEKRLGADTA